MKREHTQRRLERVVDRGWDYTLRYAVLYLAVRGKTRMLAICLYTAALVVAAAAGHRL